MDGKKLYAGQPVRRLRRRNGLTQAAMADRLGVSPSYLNLIERNQRALPSAMLVRLADLFDFDPRSLAAGEPGGGRDALRRRLADPLFSDLELDRHDLDEWLSAAPGGAEAFARAFDRAGGAAGAASPQDATFQARSEIERWRNHFADLDAAAEALAEELRLSGADLYGALTDRLRIRHGISIRIMPADVVPGLRRRLDMHARQLQLNELLAPSSRTFALAFLLAEYEARPEVEALVRGADLATREAGMLFRRHLHGYFAAATMMPYARFLRACQATRYDMPVLQARFGASFEQVAHRLTTLQRVGARGPSFFMIRVDRAGQVSKRYAGASAAALVEADGRCPLWRLHQAFDRPGETVRQLVELEDGSRWFSLSRAERAVPSLPPRGENDVAPTFSVALGLAADQAAALAAASGMDLSGPATPVGLGCRACLRPDCAQRSLPPLGRPLLVDDRERRASALAFRAG